jgi:hypothetical protein
MKSDHYCWTSGLLSPWEMHSKTLWTPKASGDTEPYIYYAFSYTYIPLIKFNSQIKHKQIVSNKEC